MLDPPRARGSNGLNSGQGDAFQLLSNFLQISQAFRMGNVMNQTREQPLVFVVDDEDLIVSTLAMILRVHGGFRARSFNRPQEALEAARFEAPDLLISDVMMPLLS
jgi:PleD family two-component response regulator